MDIVEEKIGSVTVERMGDVILGYKGSMGEIQDLLRRDDEVRQRREREDSNLMGKWHWDYHEKDGSLEFDDWKKVRACVPSEEDWAYAVRFARAMYVERSDLVLTDEEIAQVAKMKGALGLEETLSSAEGISTGKAQWVAHEAKLLYVADKSTR